MNERLQAARAAATRHSERSEESRRAQRRPQRDDVGKTMPAHDLLDSSTEIGALSLQKHACGDVSDDG